MIGVVQGPRGEAIATISTLYDASEMKPAELKDLTAAMEIIKRISSDVMRRRSEGKVEEATEQQLNHINRISSLDKGITDATS